MSTHFSKIDLENTHQNFDVIALSETFLTPETPSHIYNIPTYTLIHHDRVGKAGGGVGFYHREHYFVQILHTSPSLFNAEPEFIITEIKIKSLKVLFSVIYRPPYASSLDKFFNILSQFLPSYSHVTITGDLNIDLSRNTQQSASLNAQIKSCCLQLVSNKPTHHTMKPDGTPHHTCLDVFLTRNTETIEKFYQSSTPFTPGHDLIAIHLNVRPQPPPPSFFFSRKLHDIDSELLNKLIVEKLNASPTSPPVNQAPSLPSIPNFSQPLIDLSLHVYHSITKPQIEAQTYRLTQATLAAFNELAPAKKVKIHPSHKPWITPDLRAKQKLRDKTYRRAIRNHSSPLYQQYRQLRNQVTADVKNADNNYLRAKLKSSTETQVL